MQKKLIALAIAGLVSGGAFAQSNVTVYGSFDAGVRTIDTVNGAGDDIWKMKDSGNYNSNRFGLRGSEDMGGGLKARFMLEGDFNSGDGTQGLAGGLFRRSAWVGLEGGFGSLDLGRQYTVIFKTIGAYDPFNYKYTGIIPLAGEDGARRDSDIQWAKTFGGGFTARAQYALGEVAGDTSKGATGELGLSWANGPLNLGGAWGTQQSATTGLDTTNWTIGGAYKTAPWRFAAGYALKEADVAGGSSVDTTNWWLGGSYAWGGPHEITLAYYDTDIDAAGTVADGSTKLTILGYTYAFSKRTNLYAGVDYKKFDGISKIGGTQDSATGFSLGINHFF
ncbi:MAG: porin [Sterolibacterium sp.]|jgi:predicted porin